MPPVSRWVLSADDGDGTTVTVLYTDEVHHLCGAAAAVWRLCDGRTSFDEAVARTGLSEETAYEALLELDRLGLLRKHPRPPRSAGSLSGWTRAGALARPRRPSDGS